jgi:hypothetical protein
MGTAIYIMQVLQVLFLFIAGFFAIESVTILHSRRYRTHIMKIKKPVFILLMIGTICLTIAYSMKHVYSFLFTEIIPLASDIFFVISYITLIVAFVMLWIRTRRIHTMHQKELFFFIGVVSMVLIWLYYFFSQVLLPGTSGLPLLNTYLTYFYPAAASFLFFSTLIVHPMKHDKVIRSPLWYLSAGVFLNFLAEMMYVYTEWNMSMAFVEILYNVLFMFSAFYFLLGFYVAYKKFR